MTPASKNKKSFTLIELILVIIIMGISYSFIGNSLFSKENAIVLKLKNLPEIARDIKKSPLEFIIYGRECDKMVWIYNKEEYLDIGYKAQINAKDLKAFRLNSYGELEEFEFPDFRVENRSEPVCFKFELFSNLSNSNYIIEDKKAERFYLFHPYFKKVEIFKSLSEAEEVFRAEELNPDRV
jgi:prepilin-type N-terminal cleavage/methylation domain-containing protein